MTVPSGGPASAPPEAPAPGSQGGESTPSDAHPSAPSGASTPALPRRSELEIRWRQARNAPPPVVRAVVANVAVATVGGLVLLLYDWLATHASLPGGDQRGLAAALYVVVVIVSGSLLTYLWVELPTGASGERRRSPWAALLGLFASIPIVYLALVILFQVIRPALG